MCPMNVMIATRVDDVNPESSEQVYPEVCRRQVTPGCAAGPRFIQVHPRLLALPAEAFASYLLLCARCITGRYPTGVPLKGSDLARYFAADDRPHVARRYTQALRRLAEERLVQCRRQGGRKTCYLACWPGTQRREPLPIVHPYPHRCFVPVYLALLEQFVGTLHPAERGAARVERYVERPVLSPAMLHGWAVARWAAYRGLPKPELGQESAAGLEALGLLDAEHIYDPADNIDDVLRAIQQGSLPGVLSPAGHARLKATNSSTMAGTTGAPAESSFDRPAVGDENANCVPLSLSTPPAALHHLCQEMGRLRQELQDMQERFGGCSSTRFDSSQQSAVLPFHSAQNAVRQDQNSTNTKEKSNTRSTNTQLTPTDPCLCRPYQQQEDGGTGTGSIPTETLEVTEAEQLLCDIGVMPDNARRYGSYPTAQVRAAIAYVKQAQRPFHDPAAMVVWLLRQNRFADADDRPKCWYCGKPGCTQCAAEQEQWLRARWGNQDAVWQELWSDVRDALEAEIPNLPIRQAILHRVTNERFVLLAESSDIAMQLRVARREIERAVRLQWGAILPLYVVISRVSTPVDEPGLAQTPAWKAAAFEGPPVYLPLIQR